MFDKKYQVWGLKTRSDDEGNRQYAYVLIGQFRTIEDAVKAYNESTCEQKGITKTFDWETTVADLSEDSFPCIRATHHSGLRL